MIGGCYLEPGPKHVCVLDSLVAAFGGEAMFGFVVAALIFVVLYIAGSGGLETPTVVLILIGTVAIPMLPSNYSGIAYSVVVIGLGAGIMAVANRYFLSGAAR